MRYRNILIFSFLFLLRQACFAGSLIPLAGDITQAESGSMDTICMASTASLIDENRPSPLLQSFRIKQKKSKKVVAALLAFPFPFGIVGLHRIYLGCAPYVPVAYIASLGGVFGILPLIDFCVLLLDKDTDKFTNSKKIFMWIN